jgi:hypothetical protein
MRFAIQGEGGGKWIPHPVRNDTVVLRRVLRIVRISHIGMSDWTDFSAPLHCGRNDGRASFGKVQTRKFPVVFSRRVIVCVSSGALGFECAKVIVTAIVVYSGVPFFVTFVPADAFVF